MLLLLDVLPQSPPVYKATTLLLQYKMNAIFAYLETISLSAGAGRGGDDGGGCVSADVRHGEPGDGQHDVREGGGGREEEEGRVLMQVSGCIGFISV